MALLDSEGFGFSTSLGDFSTYNVLYASGGNYSAIETGGPLGDNYVALGGSGGNPNIVLRPVNNTTTFFAGARLNLNGSAAGQNIQFIDQAGSSNISIYFPSSGVIQAYRGNSTTLLGSSAAGVYPTNGWFYCEVGATIAPGTGGSITVQINGVQVLNLTGINTQGVSGSTSINRVQYETPQFSVINVAHYYFCDNSGVAPWNTFLGDVRVQTLAPTSNAAVNFSPQGLSYNYENAAKIPPVPGSDYNTDATVGARDTFNCPALSAGLSTIMGINVKALMAKSNAGNRYAAVLIESSGTTDIGTPVGLGVSTTLVRQMYETDPATGEQWTSAGVDAATPGYAITS